MFQHFNLSTLPDKDGEKKLQGAGASFVRHVVPALELLEASQTPEVGILLNDLT